MKSLPKVISIDGLPTEEHGKRIKTTKAKYDATNKLDVVIKADVDGSVQAIVEAIRTYKSEKIKLGLLHARVGSVTEGDIKMAHAFEGVVLGFNINIPKDIHQLAKQMNVPIKNHRVIYDLLADVKNELNNRLPALTQFESVGEGEVLKVFQLTGTRKACVAGCRVRHGVFNKNSVYRVLRDDKTVFEGKVSTLKRGLDNFDVVKKEQECGLAFEKFTDFEEGDKIECFQVKKVQDEVNWNWGF